MKDILRQTALAAANFWQGLVACAEDLDAGGHAITLARETGWSLMSVQKRLNAAAFHLNRGKTFQEVVDMGPELCVSSWQREVNQSNGKGPGEQVNWTLKVRPETRQALNGMIQKIKTVTAMDSAETGEFLAWLIDDEKEILHQFQRFMGKV